MMKVAFPSEEGCFNIIRNKFCGLDCYLITPQKVFQLWRKTRMLSESRGF